jgi:hypothetical protein
LIDQRASLVDFWWARATKAELAQSETELARLTATMAAGG